MRLAMIQLRASNIADYEQTAHHMEEMIFKVASQKPDMILLPECAYPAYMLFFDKENTELALKKLPEIETMLSNFAARYGIYVVAGLPHWQGSTLYNAAVAYGPDGAQVAWAAKRNLWHFDADSFSPGSQSRVFDTPFGRVGMMVCADGRIPEVLRDLRLQGAGLVLDAVNLVANAETPNELKNQQHAFMLRCRAQENGVYLAVCNKCGVEEKMVTYLGRSFVIGKQGQILTECGPEEETILICEIDEIFPTAGEAENVKYRIPDSYLPISSAKICNWQQGRCIYTMLVQFEARTAQEYASNATHFIAGAAVLKVRLILLPWWEGELDALCLSQIAKGLSDGTMMLLAGKKGNLRQAELWTKNGCIGILQDEEERKEDTQPISILNVDEGLSLSVCFGHQPWTPEFVRTQAIQGADISVWYAEEAYPKHLLRTRAAENKIYVVQMTRRQACSAFGPDGSLLVSTYTEREHSAATYIDTKSSRNKDVVPGTSVFPRYGI